ncbi:MAG: flagellar assembly protein FliX [Rhizomicrobium sp.]|jgi:hypothetical protein
MEIKGTSKIDSAIVRRAAKGATATDASFSVSSGAEARAQVVAGPGPIAALDAILTLQGMDDTTDGRSKGLKHGEQLLDMLDQVRDGLLAGGIPRTTLNRLANAVTRRHESFVDPKLQGVLDEIELRAHVELAKLEMSDERVA